MNPIFTLQVGEYFVAEELRKRLKSVSVFVPASPQEKGIDLLLCSFDAKGAAKTQTVQVKQSRAYEQEGGWHDLFFNAFPVSERADWFILVGVYPAKKDASKKDNSYNLEWEKIFLAFKNSEMKEFIEGLRQKKDPDKQEKHFGFKFRVSEKGEVQIFHTRGALEERKIDEHLLANQIKILAKGLNIALES